LVAIAKPALRWDRGKRSLRYASPSWVVPWLRHKGGVACSPMSATVFRNA
jgi:hypothetical protein